MEGHGRCFLFVVIMLILIFAVIKKVVVGVFLNMKFAHFLVDDFAELLYVLFVQGTDEEAVLVEFGHPGAF